MTLLVGNALCAVAADGALRLPPAMRAALGDDVLVGSHPHDACLRLYAPDYAEAGRGRLRARLDADHRAAPEIDHDARQLFGCVEPAEVRAGAITLSPLMRFLGGVEGQAMLVATGDTIEIWDPARAQESGHVMLERLAGFHLSQASALAN